MSLDSYNDRSRSKSAWAYNVFAGTNIGYLKGVCFHRKTYRILNSNGSRVPAKPNRNSGINCLCWAHADESSIIAGQVDGRIFRYNVSSETSHIVNTVKVDVDGKLKAMKMQDSNLICAFNFGTVKIFDVTNDTDSSEIFPSLTLNSWTSDEPKHLDCLDHNESFPNTILTGGNENCLKVWDINNKDIPQTPLFASKNVKNNWLNLRCPVWFTRAQFYPNSNKIVAGTGYGEVRMYDPSTSQRRPVIDVKCGEHPLTGFCVRPNSPLQVFVGDTTGFLACVDLRKNAVFKTFKGCKGGITDIVAHPKFPVFVVSSGDRFVYCYDADVSRNFINSMYLKHHLNCILCTSSWHHDDYIKPAADEGIGTVSSVSTSHQADQASGSDSADDVEDIWDRMEVVGSKRTKSHTKQSRGPKGKVPKKENN